MFWFSKKDVRVQEVQPEEILLDASNLPEYRSGRLEGKLSKPISDISYTTIAVLLVVTGVVFIGQSMNLMVLQGNAYASLSENNRLAHAPVIAERGVLYDRNGVELAWNEPLVIDGQVETFSRRQYIQATGTSHVLGYVRLPNRDSSGLLYSTSTEGVAGAEHVFDTMLQGTNGTRIVETDARQDVVGEGTIVAPLPGSNVHLSIDVRLQEGLHHAIQNLADRIPFAGGAGAIMDVRSGEILAMTSYPEYDPNVLMQGNPVLIQAYETSNRTPYLNRVVSGQYTPGSIVKPYMASAALAEGIVRPDTSFVSTGVLRVPNPYNPGQYSLFTDWRAHGTVDVRRALAVSSNIYFYHVGGGFGEQPGLGITKIHEYMTHFGFGQSTGIELEGELLGVVPSPRWKEDVFEGEDWRLGDTYNTAIGQYGWQVTPLQALRAIAAVANGGTLLEPRIRKDSPTVARQVPVSDEVLSIVREGMRQGVQSGTAVALSVPYTEIAAKTGTAELGARKEYVHSWVTGFWPYEEPRYAFVILMERGPVKNLFGAPAAARAFFDWLNQSLPDQYL
jgi:penicillin-binding protein 2